MQPHEYAELKNTLAQILKEITSSKHTDTEPLLSTEMPLGSTEQDKLFEALSKAQGEMKPAVKDSVNPFFKSKYADWATIIKASRECLAKNGLSIMQMVVDRENGQKYLYTKLGHSSGQFVASRVKVIPLKPDPQTLGSTITYLKRYSVATLICVADPYEDDDGESLMESHREQEARKKSYPYKKGAEDDQPEETPIVSPIEPVDSSVTISHDQYEMINTALEGHPDPEILKKIKTAYGKQTLADLPRADFTKIMARIQKLRRDLEK
jgi:hypothetical protein